MQRLFSVQTALPGTAKLTTVFILSLKTDLPEVYSLDYKNLDFHFSEIIKTNF